MKKVIKALLIIFSFFVVINSVDAKSLKQLREELNQDIANEAALIKKEKELQGKIDSMNKEIDELNKKIEENNNKIAAIKQKIEELNAEIAAKQKEIDNLLSFLQVSNGDNIYLEYVFQAKSFTDFIYRSAVVEQLTKYNDDLIDQMYQLIEENKRNQKDLEDEIAASEDSITKLEEILKKYGLDMNDLDEEKRDVRADIEARKIEVSEYERAYKDAGCAEDVDVKDCVNIPPAGQFVRPLEYGVITSLYGMRYHPTLHYYRMHNGLDIGGNSIGTKVYAAAAGKVNKIVNRSSCGGNMVYIQHMVKGKQYRTVYQHLHSINVSVGEYVSASTVIGTVGGGESYDGCSTGPHLHFGLLKGWDGYTYYDPRNYIDFPGKGGRFYSRW